MSIAAYDAQRAEIPARLYAEVRGSMADAMRHGMDASEASEIAACAAADLARALYGDSYLINLATTVAARAGTSLGTPV